MTTLSAEASNTLSHHCSIMTDGNSLGIVESLKRFYSTADNLNFNQPRMLCICSNSNRLSLVREQFYDPIDIRTSYVDVENLLNDNNRKPIILINNPYEQRTECHSAATG